MAEMAVVEMSQQVSMNRSGGRWLHDSDRIRQSIEKCFLEEIINSSFLFLVLLLSIVIPERLGNYFPRSADYPSTWKSAASGQPTRGREGTVPSR